MFESTCDNGLLNIKLHLIYNITTYIDYLGQISIMDGAPFEHYDLFKDNYKKSSRYRYIAI